MPNNLTISAPKIKVCGVTRNVDLEALSRAGVDSVGLNFVPSSKRCVSHALAQELSANAAALGIARVGVVMNATRAQLEALIAAVDLDFLQLHGEELPEDIEGLAGQMRIVKALPWSGRQEELELASRWGGHPRLAAFLVDAYAPGVGGGTGKVARWDLLLPRPEVFVGVPLILAGGLTADNVASAIQATQVAGVDTASGVELAVGIKSSNLILKFASNAQQAWAVR